MTILRRLEELNLYADASDTDPRVCERDEVSRLLRRHDARNACDGQGVSFSNARTPERSIGGSIGEEDRAHGRCGAVGGCFGRYGDHMCGARGGDVGELGRRECWFSGKFQAQRFRCSDALDLFRREGWGFDVPVGALRCQDTIPAALGLFSSNGGKGGKGATLGDLWVEAVGEEECWYCRWPV